MTTPVDARILRRGLRNIGDSIRLEPGRFALAAGGAILNSSMQIASAFIIGMIVDRVAVPAYQAGEFLPGTVALGIGALLALSVLRFSGMATRRIFAGLMMFQVQAHYRRLVTRRYLALPVSWHQKHPTGTLLSNANADVEAATRPLAPLPFAVGTLAMLATSMTVLFVIDWAVALVALGVLPALFILNAYFAAKMAPRAARAQELRADVSAAGHESFDGALVVKAMGREREETERFGAVAGGLRAAMVSVGRHRAQLEPGIAGRPPRGPRARAPHPRRAVPTPVQFRLNVGDFFG
jgi:ABC-type multidrug transport system fused ATPase/permease subunit